MAQVGPGAVRCPVQSVALVRSWQTAHVVTLAGRSTPHISFPNGMEPKKEAGRHRANRSWRKRCR